MDPTARDDFSRFLVHLTRDCNGNTAQQNLISILKSQRIEARSTHCLFHRKFASLRFSSKLKKKFCTVCLTEVPFTQLRHLAADIKGRQIKLKPFGLVFLKANLVAEGASPAIYINAEGTSLRDYLLRQFDAHFKTRSQYSELKNDFGAEAESIIRYYSLINVMSRTHDFSWEREWRYPGDLQFDWTDLFAIIADKPTPFRRVLAKEFSGLAKKALQHIPVVSPDWNAEQIIEELSKSLWRAQDPD